MVGVRFKENNDDAQVYYYQKNLQGDVIAIYDTAGAVQAKYSYDAFGNCTVTDSTNLHLANYNPIRYRGYYYDTKTSWYFLNARYYSPEWRRFISPDDTSYLDPESINGLNLYTYCGNNPIMCIDPMGTEVEENCYRDETDLDNQIWNSGAGAGGGTAPRGTSTSQNGGNARGANTTQNSSHLIGTNGTKIVSHTTWSCGKTERLDVENPAPGVRPGQIHYHDSNNQKYMYDFNSRQFQYSTGRLESLMTNTRFLYGLEKAYTFLGEVYGGN